MGYGIKNNKLICLDAGHFHPTEVISNKLSSIALFTSGILLHVSRSVRWAGPVEASAIGNLVVQYITLGQIADLKEAREIVRRSFPLQTYEPEQGEQREEAYTSFRSLIES